MQSAELEKLSLLVGTWQSEGVVMEDSSGPAVSIKGTDVYEWVCDEKFLLHRVDVIIGERKVEVIEMIGYDPTTKTYPMRSFDNDGNFTTMQMTIDANGAFKLSGEGMRSTHSFSADGKEMEALWERSSERGEWQPWMKMKFRK